MTELRVFHNERPVFGRDYDRGWIGFNHAESNMARAIAALENVTHPSGIVVSHAMVMTDEDECVEAAFPKGVVRTNLVEAYYEKPDRYLVFRKPKGLTTTLADRIVGATNEQVGNAYDHAKLAGYVTHAAKRTFMDWLVERACGGNQNECDERLYNTQSKWICSELAAYCLDTQDEYAGRGVLGQSPRQLFPQELFEDDELFEPTVTEAIST